VDSASFRRAEYLSRLGAIRHRPIRRADCKSCTRDLAARPRHAVCFCAFAFFCIALSPAIFFIWTYPANQATDNWATIPANWEQLRWQWEYSHAANALITFVAFCSVTLSALATRE
jgi:hypothetical protein